MVSITFRVWDIGSNGTKYTNRMTLKVHKNLAATVICIFEEIYNGQEKFPVHSLGGYSQGGKSEHTIGCAIDINPNENYYCDPMATRLSALTGCRAPTPTRSRLTERSQEFLPDTALSRVPTGTAVTAIICISVILVHNTSESRRPIDLRLSAVKNPGSLCAGCISSGRKAFHQI